MKPTSRRWIIVLAALVALYAIVGFFVLPPIVRSQLEKRVTAELGRTLTVERVKLNPFALSITIEGADLRTEDGKETFVGWRRFYANFDLLKSITKEWVLGAVELDEFRGAVAVREDGSLSVDDILRRVEQNAAPEEKKSDEPGRGVRVSRLRVSDSSFVFSDASRGEPFTTTVGPMNFSLVEFHTLPGDGAPYSFSAVTEAGERFDWRGTVGVAPLESRGDLRLEGVVLSKYAPYFQEFLNGRLESGRLSVNGRYDVRLDEAGQTLRFTEGGVKLEELRVLDAAGEAVAHFPLIEVAGIDADGVAMRAKIASVSVQGGRARVERLEDGQINLLQLVKTPPADSAASANAPAPAAVPSGGEPPLDLLVDDIRVQDVAVQFRDATLPEPPLLTLNAIQTHVARFTLARDARMPLEFSFNWDPQGTFELKGEFGLDPLAADLQLELRSLALAPVSPFLAPFTTAKLADGALSVSGKVTLTTPAEGDPALGFSGDVRMENIGLVDHDRGEPLAGLAQLQVDGIQISTTPELKVATQAVRLRGPFARVVVDENGTMNLTSAFPSAETTADEKSATPAPAEKPAPLPEITVGQLAIEQGDFTFNDRSVKPAVNLSIKDFETVLSNLSSREPGRGEAKLKARINGAGPMSLDGKLDPLAAAPRADLKAGVQSVDLRPLSPYMGKYAGFELARGRLFVDSTMKLADDRLNLVSTITLDQFTFGQRVESPDATQLPVRLGVALLKDSSGKIVLNIPVSGSLNDPSFEIGPVVSGVVINLLKKAATSPFSLLGSMFGGGGEELGRQDFLAGTAEFTPESQQRLQVLERALNERPALNLSITGGYNPDADRPALQREKINQQVQERARQLAAAAESEDANTAVSGDAFATALRALFDERFADEAETGAPLPEKQKVQAPEQAANRGILRRAWDWATFKNARDRRALERAQNEAQAKREPEIAAAKEQSGLPIEEMIGRLAQTVEITPEEFAQLAETRAQRVRDHLLEAGIAEERLILSPAPDRAAQIGTHAELELQ